MACGQECSAKTYTMMGDDTVEGHGMVSSKHILCMHVFRPIPSTWVVEQSSSYHLGYSTKHLRIG